MAVFFYFSFLEKVKTNNAILKEQHYVCTRTLDEMMWRAVCLWPRLWCVFEQPGVPCTLSTHTINGNFKPNDCLRSFGCFGEYVQILLMF